MNNMSIDYELLEEFREELKDRYTPIEICELFIESLELSEDDILDIFGDERIVELKFR
jgi:type I restriction-modification system DNA methylase subunit